MFASLLSSVMPVSSSIRPLDPESECVAPELQSSVPAKRPSDTTQDGLHFRNRVWKKPRTDYVQRQGLSTSLLTSSQLDEPVPESTAGYTDKRPNRSLSNTVPDQGSFEKSPRMTLMVWTLASLYEDVETLHRPHLTVRAFRGHKCELVPIIHAALDDSIVKGMIKHREDCCNDDEIEINLVLSESGSDTCHAALRKNVSLARPDIGIYHFPRGILLPWQLSCGLDLGLFYGLRGDKLRDAVKTSCERMTKHWELTHPKEAKATRSAFRKVCSPSTIGISSLQSSPRRPPSFERPFGPRPASLEPLGRSDKDERSSLMSTSTGISSSRSHKRPRCHACKDTPLYATVSLVKCSTCSRYYHHQCHTNPPIPRHQTEKWQCRPCVKKKIPPKSVSSMSPVSLDYRTSTTSSSDRVFEVPEPSRDRLARYNMASPTHSLRMVSAASDVSVSHIAELPGGPRQNNSPGTDIKAETIPGAENVTDGNRMVKLERPEEQAVEAVLCITDDGQTAQTTIEKSPQVGSVRKSPIHIQEEKASNSTLEILETPELTCGIEADLVVGQQLPLKDRPTEPTRNSPGSSTDPLKPPQRYRAKRPRENRLSECTRCRTKTGYTPGVENPLCRDCRLATEGEAVENLPTNAGHIGQGSELCAPQETVEAKCRPHNSPNQHVTVPHVSRRRDEVVDGTDSSPQGCRTLAIGNAGTPELLENENGQTPNSRCQISNDLNMEQNSSDKTSPTDLNRTIDERTQELIPGKTSPSSQRHFNPRQDDELCPKHVENLADQNMDNSRPSPVEDLVDQNMDNSQPKLVEDLADQNMDNSQPDPVGDLVNQNIDNSRSNPVEDLTDKNMEHFQPDLAEDNADENMDNSRPDPVEDPADRNKDNCQPYPVEDNANQDMDNSQPSPVEFLDSTLMNHASDNACSGVQQKPRKSYRWISPILGSDHSTTPGTVTLNANAIPGPTNLADRTNRPSVDLVDLTVDNIDLGNWSSRPIGTWEKLCCIALSAAPGHRLRPTDAAKWIAENIPGYNINTSDFRSRISATLASHRAGGHGDTGNRHWKRVKNGEVYYELLPGALERIISWDPVARKPVRPVLELNSEVDETSDIEIVDAPQDEQRLRLPRESTSRGLTRSRTKTADSISIEEVAAMDSIEVDDTVQTPSHTTSHTRPSEQHEVRSCTQNLPTRRKGIAVRQQSAMAFADVPSNKIHSTGPSNFHAGAGTDDYGPPGDLETGVDELYETTPQRDRSRGAPRVEVEAHRSVPGPKLSRNAANSAEPRCLRDNRNTRSGAKSASEDANEDMAYLDKETHLEHTDGSEIFVGLGADIAELDERAAAVQDIGEARDITGPQASEWAHTSRLSHSANRGNTRIGHAPRNKAFDSIISFYHIPDPIGMRAFPIKDLYKEWPELNPQKPNYKKRPGRKARINASIAHGPAIEPWTLQPIKAGPLPFTYGPAGDRFGRDHNETQSSSSPDRGRTIQCTHPSQMTGCPDNLLSVIHNGELAFRDNKRNADRTLPRARFHLTLRARN